MIKELNTTKLKSNLINDKLNELNKLLLKRKNDIAFKKAKESFLKENKEIIKELSKV